MVGSILGYRWGVTAAKGRVSTALSIWQRALWDSKVYKQAKFGDSFDRGMLKRAQKRQQITRQNADGRSRMAGGVNSKSLNSRYTCAGLSAHCD